jgi:hypothetical protein
MIGAGHAGESLIRQNTRKSLAPEDIQVLSNTVPFDLIGVAFGLATVLTV